MGSALPEKKGGNLKDIILKTALPVLGIIAALIRIFYIWYTPVWRRQHDVLDFGAGEGQAAFIEFFHDGHFLLDFDPREKWGFFQPPLHHMISALFIRIQELCGIAYVAACEHVQILMLIYSLITLFFAYKIFRYFRLEGSALIISFAIAAMHPGFILMSGSINNDMLTIMLTVIAFYLTLKWNEKPSWLLTVLLALTIGFGMMTKLSAALIAPPVAIVFLIRMIKGGMDDFVTYMKKYVAFCFICAPLALWSPIRNYIVFGVPLSYTPSVGEPVEASLFRRIFDIRCYSPYISRISNGDPYDEFNILLGMMKTSLFGDENFAYAVSEAGHSRAGYALISLFGWTVLISGVILAFIALYATIRELISDRDIAADIRVFIAAVYLTGMYMYISFVFKAPYMSSMDFRYVLYLIVVEALMAGLYLNKGRRVYRMMLLPVAAVFAASSVIEYIMLYWG